MKQITAYQCSMCGKVYVTKPAAEKHECKCIKDPDNKTCATCLYDCESGGNRRCEHWPEGKTFRRDCPNHEFID